MNILSEVITSRKNPKVKWAASLSEKKHRNEYGYFIAEGEKLALEAIDAGVDIKCIFISEGKRDAMLELIKRSAYDGKIGETEIITVSEEVFEKISTEKSPQGIICVIKYLDILKYTDIIYKEEFFSSEEERALILCSLRDPGNLGTVIRSATAFGVDHIILSRDSADVYNPRTVRAAMGGLFKTRITIVSDIAEAVACARQLGRRVYAAELTDRAVSILDMDISKNDILIIGNEGHGIPLEISEKCNGSVFIPISKTAESLNAAIAAAVFMWEQSK